VATESPLCLTPEVPGGKPVTAEPGATPSWPVIQVGPVLVTVLPARTAKWPAVPSPGSVAASAEAGHTRKTRAARASDRPVRRLLITLHMLFMGHNKVSKIGIRPGASRAAVRPRAAEP